MRAVAKRAPSRVIDAADVDTLVTRIDAWGAAALSDAELVTLLTADGERADTVAAHALLTDGLVALVRRAVDRAGMSAPGLRRIAAAIELTRRATTALPDATAAPVDVSRLGMALVARHAFDVQERLGVVLLDTRGRCIAERVLFVGSLRSALVSTRELLHIALARGAAGIIVYHNHPSGDPTPSAEDDTFTRKLATALDLADVTLVDHLVLGARRYRSYRDDGALASLPTNL